MRAIAVRPDASTGKAEEDDISIIDASKSMQFVLCGLGQNCSISQGEASAARHSLLRRQALELSLYTFKYVDDIESGDDLPAARRPVASRRAARSSSGAATSSRSWRSRSRATMAPGAPSIGSIPARELQTLNRITSAQLYRYEYTQAQDLSAVLVLDPSHSLVRERMNPAVLDCCSRTHVLA